VKKVLRAFIVNPPELGDVKNDSHETQSGIAGKVALHLLSDGNRVTGRLPTAPQPISFFQTGSDTSRLARVVHFTILLWFGERPTPACAPAGG
jgi:hypothetical protein